MKCQYKNFYFTNRDDLNIAYDFENNKIISYPSTVNLKNVLAKLLEDLDIELSDDERDLCNYLKMNLKEVDETQFNSYDYLEKNGFQITSASFMIAQNCNLHCTYCYGGDSGQYHSSKSLMTKEVAKLAIQRLVQDNRKDSEIVINFFGGEPLMNFDLIQFVVNECKLCYPQSKFAFSLTTNTTLINSEIADFFKENCFRVMVSIDGYKEIHNHHRKFRNGTGSFDKVIEGIQILKEKGVEFRIRATLDHRFYDKYQEINDFLKSLGSDRVTISRLVNYNDDQLTFPLNISDIKYESAQLKAYLENAVKEALAGKFPRNFPYISHFKKIVFAERSLMNCGAYEGGTAISSDGKYYPCHRFVGMEDFDFGDVFNGVNKEKLKKQLSSLDENTRYCNKCFGKYICQRSCFRDLAKSGGRYIQHDLEYCQLLKDTVDDALLTYYLILVKRPEFFNTNLLIEDNNLS